MTNISSIGRQIAKGAGWAVLMRIAIRSLGFISTIVLARLLTPDDYGVIALAMIFVGLLEALTWFGFDVVLIQDQDAPIEKYHSVWTLTVMRGLILGAILFLAAPLCATLFNEPRLITLLQLLACGTVIEGFACTGVVDFRKRLEFDRDFKMMVIPRLLSFFITLILAVIWRDYWAMAVGMVSGKVTSVMVGYAMHPYRPRFSLQYWHTVFGFSKWLLANSLLRFGYGRGDSMILGKIAGSQVLGVYAVAYEISNMVLTELVAPIQRAILPGYAKLGRSKSALREIYLNTFAVTVTAALPIATGIMLTADLFVPLLLGEKWLQTIPLIRILCLSGMLHVGVSNSGAVYVAIGKPWLITVLYGVSLPIGIPLVVLGVAEFGAIGAAMGVTSMAAVFVLVNGILITRTLALRISDIAQQCLRPAVAALTMTATVLAVRYQLPIPDGLSALGEQLVMVIVIGAIVYAGADLALWFATGRPDGPERQVIRLVRSRFGR